MNTKTATYNASDIWEKWLDKMLRENPEFWTKSSRSTKRKRQYLYKHKKPSRRKSIIAPLTPVDEVMEFSRWYRIVTLYYLLARKEIIKGNKVMFSHRIGTIRARTVSRNFKKKMINWAETKKQPIVEDPVTGKKHRAKKIYYTSESYSRIKWEKLKSLKNEKSYKFEPSKGSAGGFRKEFKMALKADPLLETRYKQFLDELI